MCLAAVRAASSKADLPTLESARATVARVMKAGALRQPELLRLHWDRRVAKMLQEAMGQAHQ